MKNLLVIITLTALFASMAAPANAQSSSNQLFVSAGVGLNLRTGPSTGYQILTTMPYGSVVSTTGNASGDWLEVSYGQTTGWAHSNWLTSNAQQSAAPTSSSASGGGGSITSIIYDAAARYGVSGDWLLAVAQCESNLVPGAYGAAGEVGIFQFMPSTYYGYGGQGDIWNPYNQADLAASMFAQGLSYHWTCAR
jgi:uncharacterized protein YraI